MLENDEESFGEYYTLLNQIKSCKSLKSMDFQQEVAE